MSAPLPRKRTRAVPYLADLASEEALCSLAVASAVHLPTPVGPRRGPGAPSFPLRREPAAKVPCTGTFDVEVEGETFRLPYSLLARRSATVRHLAEDVEARRLEVPRGLGFEAGIARLLTFLAGAAPDPPEADVAQLPDAARYLGVELTPDEVLQFPPFLVTEGLRYGPVAYLSRFSGPRTWGIALCRGKRALYASFAAEGGRLTWLFGGVAPEAAVDLIADLAEEPLRRPTDAARLLPFAPLALLFGRVALLRGVSGQFVTRAAVPSLETDGETRPRRLALCRGLERPESALGRAGEGEGEEASTGEVPAAKKAEDDPLSLAGHPKLGPLFAPSLLPAAEAWPRFNAGYVRALFSGLPLDSVIEQLAPPFARLTSQRLRPFYFPWIPGPGPCYAHLAASGELALTSEEDVYDHSLLSGTGLKLTAEHFRPGRVFAQPGTNSWVYCATTEKNTSRAFTRWGLALTGRGPASYLVTRGVRPGLLLLPFCTKVGCMLRRAARRAQGGRFVDEGAGAACELGELEEIGVRRTLAPPKSAAAPPPVPLLLPPAEDALWA